MKNKNGVQYLKNPFKICAITPKSQKKSAFENNTFFKTAVPTDVSCKRDGKAYIIWLSQTRRQIWLSQTRRQKNKRQKNGKK